MTRPRRVGTETSAKRADLLDAAERLMLAEGYAAVTYRVVAAQAGMTPSLVQYYFPTLDELFLALVRRRSEQTVGALVRALETDQPLRAIWEFANNRTAAALIAELMALANHRKAIRSEIAAVGEQVRELTLAAMARSGNDYTSPLVPVSPEILVFLLTSSPRMMRMEQAVGMSGSHTEVADFLAGYLDKVEPSSTRGTAPDSPTPR
ncbi:TetR/AcrR family transcriptional regulator [Frankia sp. AgB1.9]|uniref:TetR/AcrR family transcriptional regulator n=1 Tax=unclassified Frankia TaxID=2632575 RepID=UPI00193302E7|nr:MULTISPECIES: TetR/AcrR family transcriptional regulator [unclassified Frankia]MBL7491718.1 TetR/AcrR family transcriptional regulator [Frankia sp. AgW1.1]MBL7550839.1 TetR/AcrR family transcriptional regulator [Frankia sp. AgB1.9]MBL7625160.1 TetR/AcrR family transcriptional regulator [Frankia sp. AgB1.8]